MWLYQNVPASGCFHGPLTRYVKLWAVHASGMPGTFSPPPTSKETASWRSRHASRHVRLARAVMHVGIANPRWREKRSRHSRRMRNPQFYLSVQRTIVIRRIHPAVFSTLTTRTATHHYLDIANMCLKCTRSHCEYIYMILYVVQGI